MNEHVTIERRSLTQNLKRSIQFFGWVLLLAASLKANANLDRLNSCPGINLPDTINDQIANCNAMTSICLTIPFAEISDYTITDNGVGYNQSIAPCDFDTIFVYNYASLPGGGASGPYTVNNWTVNGTSFTGQIIDMQDLVDSLNSWDNGNWTLDIPSSSISGGNAFSNYSSLVITQDFSGDQTTLTLTTNLNPRGSMIIVDTGFHEIILTNASLACIDTTYAVIDCINCPFYYSGPPSYDLASCQDIADVCLDIPYDDRGDFTVEIDGAPYTGAINACSFDTTYAYDYSSLEGFGFVGPYILQGWGVNGSSFLGSFSDVADLVDSMNVWDASANWTIDLTNLQIRGGNTSSQYTALSILQPSGATANLPLEIRTIPGNMSISLSEGTYNIRITDNQSICSDAFSIGVSCPPLIICPSYYTGGETIEAASCEVMTNICTSIRVADRNQFEIYDNGILYSGNELRCGDMDTVGFIFELSVLDLLPIGSSYELDSWEINGSTVGGISFDDFSELADSMSAWDVSGNWVHSGSMISGGDLSNNYGSLIISGGAASPQLVSIMPDMEAQDLALELDTGYHEIIFINTMMSCSDTNNITINCTSSIPCDPLVTQDNYNFTILDCSETVPVCLDVEPSVWDTYTVSLDGSSFVGSTQGCQGQITGYSYLIDLNGIGASNSNFEVISWFVNGNEFSGMFSTPQELLNLLNTWDSQGNWTFDAVTNIYRTINTSNAYSDISIRASIGGDLNIIIFRTNEEEVFNATSLDFDSGDHVLVLTNPEGCSDSVFVSVTCIEDGRILDTINVNQTDTICLAGINLPGTLDTIYNDCANQSGEYVLFEVLESGFCVSFTGVEAGQDSACIIVCDDQDNCVTQTLLVEVIDTMTTSNPGLVAVSDTVETIENQVVIIDFLNNDTFPLVLDTFYIVEDPDQGAVLLNIDGTITYSPETDYCDPTRLDQFSYAICDANGCDTATVYVRILCDDLTAYTGFSPNGDGANDFFVITGLQNYPSHTLTIFNRWGNQVFIAEGYQNDWNGTMEGNPLPDGTYFYILETQDGVVRSDYVQIAR